MVLAREVLILLSRKVERTVSAVFPTVSALVSEAVVSENHQVGAKSKGTYCARLSDRENALLQ